MLRHVLMAVALSIAAPTMGRVVVARPNPGQARDSIARTTTGRVKGRITAGDSGTGLAGAQVRIVSSTLHEDRLITTDASGAYEFRDLPAGRYSLFASKGSYVPLQYGQTRPFVNGRPIEVGPGETLEQMSIALPRGAVIAGRVVDGVGEPVADALVTAVRSQVVAGRRRLVPAGRLVLTNDLGDYRIFGLPPGHYHVTATIGGSFNAAESSDRVGYAPTYYPGTVRLTDAQRMTLRVGEERGGANFAIATTKLAVISGTAADAHGRPMEGGSVVLLQTGGGLSLAMAGAQVKPDGSFTVTNVAPGDYLLQLTSNSAMTAADESPEVALMPVTVTGDDLTSVSLIARKLVTVSGHVILEAERPNVAASAIQLRISSKAGEDQVVAKGSTARLNDDWTFSLKAHPGESLLRLATAPAGWVLKAVRLNASDIVDSGLVVSSDTESLELEVVLTNRTSQILGRVSVGQTATADYSVVVFSDNSERWGFRSRYVRVAAPDQKGQFSIKGLPPGKYLAAAVDYIEQGEVDDPEFLEQLRSKAVSLDVDEDQKKDLVIPTVLKR